MMVFMNLKLLMELSLDIIENIKRARKHLLIQLPVFMLGQEVNILYIYISIGLRHRGRLDNN